VADELKITADVSKALGWVLGAAPTSPEPVLVLGTYLDALAKGYGMSDSTSIDWDPLERAAPPGQALPLLRHYLAAEGADLDADCLRDRLYAVLVDLAESGDARKTLNSNGPLTEVELLRAGQVYWNLEGTKDRPRLPIRPDPIRKVGPTGHPRIADIPTPDRTRDFATLRWTDRVNEPKVNRSSAGGFRQQGARLAVLAAQHIIDSNRHPAPALEGASLITSKESEPPRIVAIVWPEVERVLATPVQSLRQATEPGGAVGPSAVLEQSRAALPGPDTPWVVLGALADVGADYQRRGFDDVLDRLWADGGDRRVWLRGGPGLGKTYSARRVMQQARADQSPDREELLLWVDSADAAAVIEAFAGAVDELRQRGFAMPVGIDDPAPRKAQVLLRVLATSTWRWLIVLDNANAGLLLDAGLIPTGVNPQGRVLLTTRSRDNRISSHGRQVDAALFTPEEATAYLRSEVHSHTGGAGVLTAASATETSRLAEAVGYHPLALSIATGTIVANAMSVAEWLDEYASAPLIDSAADEPDRGGYPHLISATWQIALDRASQGLPDGVVQRAAMVAAIQDPDGHPTWLWERDDVSRWVAGGPALARRHGVPVAIQRLIDSGVVQLRGDTWKHGKVAIHQLAARAVRELAGTAALAELAGIVVHEWLRQLTANRREASNAAIRSNLHPIAVLSDLAPIAQQAVTALLGYAQPKSIVLTMVQEDFEDMVPYLTRGGAFGQGVMAHQLFDIGDRQEDLGLLDEARATHSSAAEIYRQVLEDPSLDDELRASHLSYLGGLEDRLDQPAQARGHRMQAVKILDRLTQTSLEPSDLFKYLAALADFHDQLGSHEERARVLDRAAALPIPAHDPTATDTVPTTEEGQAQDELGRHLHTLGRIEEAKACFVQAAQIYEQLEDVWKRDDVLGALARLHMDTDDWGEAEACLRRVAEGKSADGDDYLLLASVQQHLGRAHDADQNLARAAEEYGEIGLDPEPSPAQTLGGEAAELLAKIRASGHRMVLSNLLARAFQRERWEDAAGLAAGFLDLTQQRSEASGADHDTEAKLAQAHEMVGSTSLLAGRPDMAILHFRQAGTIRQLLVDLAPGDTQAQTGLAHNLGALGMCHNQLGQLEQALEALVRSAAIYRQLADQAPDDRATQDKLANVLHFLGHTQAGLGDREQSLASLRGRVNILQMLAELAPADAQALSSLADTLCDVGRTCLRDLDQPDEALQWLTRAQATYRDHLARFGPASPSTRGDLAEALELLVYATVLLDRPDETLRYLSEVVDIRRGLAADAPDVLESQLNLARNLITLGAVHHQRDELDQAETCFTSSSATLQLLSDLEPGDHERMLIMALRGLAETLTRLGNTEEADKATTRADTLEEEYPNPDD
jgi:tetratricopeptide (TPR) repeat protein